MNGCVNGVYRLSYSCCLGSGHDIEMMPQSGRPSMSLCDKKSKYVIQSEFLLPTGRGSVRPGRRKSLKVTYKGEVKRR